MEQMDPHVISQANAYLGGAPATARTVLKWREALRGGREPALARRLSRKLAEDFIAGWELDERDVDGLWNACKSDEAFSHARRVLHRRLTNTSNVVPAREEYPKRPTPQKLREQSALMTSKDPDLSASMRHDWALRILEPDLQTSSAETLGIAGGIWKRRWEFDGKTASLEKSLRHYLAPVERGRAEGATDAEHDRNGNGVTAEDGYPAINAAFVCNLLGKSAADSTAQDLYRSRAAALRARICEAVAATNYWTHATLAESRFGLGDIDHAVELMHKAAQLETDPWERETTARQIARLGDALGVSQAATGRVVDALVGDGDDGDARVRSILIGKVGLALSGGGFRASLYHLGVLARLVESDVLRHVEALSMVSGGSMVGAAYYLRLRKLLRRTGTPGAADYVTLVKDLIEDFRQGTNANLRTALFEDLDVCRALINGDDALYSKRMAEAVFRTLYSRAVDDGRDPHMKALPIEPDGEVPHFHPRYHNSRRRAKVPALLINATTLNTGHSWQFTTTSMGESPFSIVAGADAMPRLRRSYYRDANGKPMRGVTLSQAVAASACVPGLFAPLALSDVYEEYDVRLVDGGVYDNQGALGLLQEDCSVLIISDACGQLAVAEKPGGRHLSPLMRAFDIFQERMRLGGFENLRSARDTGRLGGLAYVHLKQDLDADPVDWVDCEDPVRPGDQLPAMSNANPRTRYNVWKPHQEALAAIRTDLDAFSDIEAAALMASGYLAMDAEMQRLARDVPMLVGDTQRESWFFSSVVPKLAKDHDRLLQHLRSGSKQFLRLFAIDHAARNVALALVGSVALVVAVLLWLNRSASWTVTITVRGVALALGLWLLWYVATRNFSGWAGYLVNPTSAVKAQVGRWLGAVSIWALARWIVPRYTKRYLAQGTLDKLG